MRVLYRLAYGLVVLAPVWGVVGFLFGPRMGPVLTLGPLFLLLLPAGLFLLSRKCRACGRVIYTVESLRAVGALYRFPTHYFRRCANCDAPIPYA